MAEPTLLFDKSTVQSLSREQAEWLLHFFRGVMTPVYMAEVAGNLAKDFDGRMEPDRVVAAFADKTNHLQTVANVSHLTLIEGELMGHRVEMRGVPVIGGGVPITAENGEVGLFFDEPVETRILRRWSQGEFEEAERERARAWRIGTKAIDLNSLSRAMRLPKEARSKLTTVALVVEEVDRLLADDTARFKTLDLALRLFDLPPQVTRAVRAGWPKLGRPPLREIAPYTFYVLRVTLTFLFGVASGAITTRPTNLVDLQYAYYLPFCAVFTSGDKLHRDLAKSFMTEDQFFLPADDARVALGLLVAYYSKHSEELKRRGRAFFAHYPPLDIHTAVHDAYDRVLPAWRANAAIPHYPPTVEQSAAIMAQLKPMIDAIERRDRRVDDETA